MARLVLCSLQTDLNPDPSSLPFILQRLDRDGSVLKGPPGYQVSNVSIMMVFLAMILTKIIVNGTVMILCCFSQCSGGLVWLFLELFYAVLCTEVVHSHKCTLMSSSYSFLDGFCLTGPISLCLGSLCLCLCFLCYLVILHMCCIIVTRCGGPGGIED